MAEQMDSPQQENIGGGEGELLWLRDEVMRIVSELRYKARELNEAIASNTLSFADAYHLAIRSKREWAVPVTDRDIFAGLYHFSMDLIAQRLSQTYPDVSQPNALPLTQGSDDTPAHEAQHADAASQYISESTPPIVFFLDFGLRYTRTLGFYPTLVRATTFCELKDMTPEEIINIALAPDKPSVSDFFHAIDLAQRAGIDISEILGQKGFKDPSMGKPSLKTSRTVKFYNFLHSNG